MIVDRDGVDLGTSTHDNVAISGASVIESRFTDPIETALADALVKATAVGQWDVVSQLARELETRRQARGGVVDLDKERTRRKGA